MYTCMYVPYSADTIPTEDDDLGYDGEDIYEALETDDPSMSGLPPSLPPANNPSLPPPPTGGHQAPPPIPTGIPIDHTQSCIVYQ